MDYDSTLSEARKAIDGLSDNTVFEVKDLFEGTKWTKYPKGERIGFGRYFSNKVRNGRIEGIVRLERGKDNHTRYQKI